MVPVSDVKTVCALAQGVWSTCMQKHSRTANHHRSDRGVKRTMDGEPRSIVKEEGKPSEREFWRRSHQQTKMLISSSASSSSAAPPVVDFDPGHTKELAFQNKKWWPSTSKQICRGSFSPRSKHLQCSRQQSLSKTACIILCKLGFAMLNRKRGHSLC